MKFTKMQGCGNDYVYINCFQEKINNPETLAKLLSDRHFGIGGDGLILIKPSKAADCMMEMYNADGSQGEMCGNGIRCLAKYAYDYGIVNKTSISVETKAGIKELELTLEDNMVKMVTVDMGEPIVTPKEIPAISDEEAIIDALIEVEGIPYTITAVSMGNPHGVVFVEDTKVIELEKIGPGFEHHPMFPNRVNTEFIQIVDKNTINMRVWERGSGETLACGTGACASVYAAILNGRTDDQVLVHLLGGDLTIFYNRADNHIYMTGPAEVVFDGEINIEKLHAGSQEAR